jgi:predicted ATPase
MEQQLQNPNDIDAGGLRSTIQTMTAPHKLTRVTLERFASFESATLEIRDLNVLIGPNGAGKSNFLAFFDMVGSLIEQRLGVWVGEQGGADRVLFGGVKRSSDLSFRLEFADGGQGYEASISAGVGGQVFFGSEQAWGTGFGQPRPFNVGLGSGHSESLLPKEVLEHPGGVVSWTLACLRGWVRYHFHDTSRTAGVKQRQPLNDSRELRRDGRNLAPFLYRLKLAGDPSLVRIRDAVRSVAPFFDDFILEPDPFLGESILLEWRHRDSDVYGDASMLSDGTLRFLCLATVLLQPDPPAVVLIDEPELGLHPYAITQLAELLEAASQRCQIIVSTQSVTLLDRLRVEDVVIAERVDGATKLARLDLSQLSSWLEDYSVGDLWMKNLIGARPRSTQ